MLMVLKRLQRLFLFSALLALGACATTGETVKPQSWMTEVMQYESTLASDHPDRVENLFTISPEIIADVKARFGRYGNTSSVRRLARWLVDQDGKDMLYDIEANLTPNQTYQQNRGNCLSFTLMLVQLAAELGVELNVNEVDLPDVWGQDENRDLVFYRHVNAVHKNDRFTQVFDLAMDQYDHDYPQRFITRRAGAALLYSNLGVQKLRESDVASSFHYHKLAVSLSPDNPDTWVNLAAAFKRTGQIDKAEQAYLYAASLNDQDSIAASNLERLYRGQGRLALAEKYGKLAHRARQRNPYIHFQKAQEAFIDQDYITARKSIKRAIKLYPEDPQFYELRSRLHQINLNYIAALKDLEKAHNKSKNLKDRGRYASKVDKVLARAKQVYEEQAREQRRR